jgi:acetate kinase
VFSGGVGERSAPLRAAVVRAAACLGFALDEAANDAVSSAGEGVVEIGSAPGEGGKRVLVCPTDEQVEMARACALDGEYW